MLRNALQRNTRRKRTFEYRERLGETFKAHAKASLKIASFSSPIFSSSLRNVLVGELKRRWVLYSFLSLASVSTFDSHTTHVVCAVKLDKLSSRFEIFFSSPKFNATLRKYQVKNCPRCFVLYEKLEISQCVSHETDTREQLPTHLFA